MPPHHYLLALPCGAHRLKRRVWIATVTLPDFNALFGNSAPPWFWTWGRIIWQDARVRICRIVTAMSTGRTNLRIYVKTFFFKTALYPTRVSSLERAPCAFFLQSLFSHYLKIDYVICLLSSFAMYNNIFQGLFMKSASPSR